MLLKREKGGKNVKIEEKIEKMVKVVKSEIRKI